MTHILVCALTLTGFALLLMAMARHQQDWLRRKLAPNASRSLKWIRFTVLALGFAAACRGLYGTVAWFGWLSLSAVLVLNAQTNRERIRRLFP
ncbi:DUF3325 domain-containing protein [Novosphingobium guangzhouense]|uniref:DUF3325 domain-containing protein n=1 Tax=Novosphingobium guangzhouense TaxID=1850347 RepID=A0A2K2G701_9SPHN|nr:DUF3325 domain-containing protein [Novosphingobium guangzhouense]PNU06800.1 hypothetical protein A8V01_01050 [Novosphingobium guangzhouense]